jgi:hypothetical protein
MDAKRGFRYVYWDATTLSASLESDCPPRRSSEEPASCGHRPVRPVRHNCCGHRPVRPVRHNSLRNETYESGRRLHSHVVDSLILRGWLAALDDLRNGLIREAASNRVTKGFTPLPIRPRARLFVAVGTECF